MLGNAIKFTSAYRIFKTAHCRLRSKVTSALGQLARTYFKYAVTPKFITIISVLISSCNLIDTLGQ